MVEEQQLDAETFLATVKFDKDGLVPAIVQDSNTGQVLMMAWMNAESLRSTLKRGETIFWSRSRQELWHKGATSGNVQRVLELVMEIHCSSRSILLALRAIQGQQAVSFVQLSRLWQRLSESRDIQAIQFFGSLL